VKEDLVMRNADFSPLYVPWSVSTAWHRCSSSRQDRNGLQLAALQHRKHRRERLPRRDRGGRLQARRAERRGQGEHPDRDGRKAANDENKRYLHRGLAERNFERRFQLADYVFVTDAQLADGLLSISLKRELPEAMKPRQIAIKSGAPRSPC
jgi:hypothetical protein